MIKKMIKTINKAFNTEPQLSEQSNANVIEVKKQEISRYYEQNREIFKALFSIPKSVDVKIREFTIRSLKRRAFIIYIDTMVDTDQVQRSIVEPLIENEQPTGNVEDIVSFPVAQTIANIGEITENITRGVTALFVDGDEQCYAFETTKISGRAIEKSDNEVIVKGAKEAFNERLADNVGLIRKKIKNENLRSMLLQNGPGMTC